jgi:phosphate transport system protein
MKAEKLYKIDMRVNEFFRHVDYMMDNTINGIRNKDIFLLQEVSQNSEPRSNRLQLRIDQMCQVYIAKFEPKAYSLRKVITCIKIIATLERISDHIFNISQSFTKLIKESGLYKADESLIQLFSLTQDMYKNSILSVATENPILAKEIIEKDTEVNNLRDKIIHNSLIELTNKSNQIEILTKNMEISRNIERIADLTTNICEDLIYRITGEIYRRSKS